MSKTAVLYTILLSFYVLMMPNSIQAFSDYDRECLCQSNPQDYVQRGLDKSAGCKIPLQGPQGPPGVCTNCSTGCLVAILLPNGVPVTQCENITAPLIIVVPKPITPPSVTGSFIGQLGFFQVDNTLRTWDGSVWVP